MDETIEITYSVLGYDEVGETTFDMDVSERTYERLQDAESEGEILNSEYISEEMNGLHKKILRAIRKNFEEESMFNPDDGMVKKRYPWGGSYKEFEYDASHEALQFCEDDDIEYEVNLF